MKKLTLIVLGLLIVLSLVACSLLPGSQPTPLVVTQVVTVLVPQEPVVPLPPTVAPPPTPTPLPPTETPIPVETTAACGGSGVMQLLLLGEALWEGNELRGADAIRLMKVDFDNDAVTILAMPPTLWVNTPNLAGVDATTLTNSYRRAKDAAASQGDRASMVQGTQALAQALLDNFGYQPDHYITLSQELFASMVNTLGGIEIILPARVDGTAEGHGVFEAGPQVFTGVRADDYVRILQPNNLSQPDEWGRIERQNQVVDALRASILQPDNWLVMPTLIGQFAELVVTDLTPNQLLDLNCMVDSVGENIILMQVGPDMVTVDSQGNMIPDEAAIRSLIDVTLSQ